MTSSAAAFGILLRFRLRMVINAVQASPPWQKAVVAGLSLFAAVLFLVIGGVCAGLVRLAQGTEGTGLPGVSALIERLYEYLFFFLLAGSVPFVAATLFQADDLSLLLPMPLPPRAVVAAKLMDAMVVNAAQFLALGVPVLVGTGWGVGLSASGWGWLLASALLLLTLAPAGTAALLLAMAGVLGMRRVRVAVLLVSVGLGSGMTALAVVGVSRASRAGVVDVGRLASVLRSAPTTTGRGAAGPFPTASVEKGGGGSGANWLPSAWAAAMLEETAGGHGLRARGALGLLGLVTTTAVLIAACLALGPGVLASEAFLENADTGRAVTRIGRAAGRRDRLSPVWGLVLKDGKYVQRDLILLGQIGTTLILFFVPFLLRVSQQSVAADNDIYGGLALGMLALIAYMLTSILSLTSVGLEGRAGWIVLAAPLGRGTFLRAKWLGAFGLSAAITGALALLDWAAFRWAVPVAGAALAALLCACFALSGLGVGLAGLFPRFVYENPAHRASVWALILGFVLATGYVIGCGLIAGGGYVAVTQAGVGLRAAAGVGTVGFLLLSAVTALVPVGLAARRLRGYEWEL